MKWWSLGLHGLLRMFFLDMALALYSLYVGRIYFFNLSFEFNNHRAQPLPLCLFLNLPLFWVVSFSIPYSSPDHMPNATCGVPPKQLQVRWVLVCFLHQETQAYVRIGAGLDRRRRAHDYSDGDSTPLTWWFHPSHLRQNPGNQGIFESVGKFHQVPRNPRCEHISRSME